VLATLHRLVDIRLDGPRMERFLVPLALHVAQGRWMPGVLGHIALASEGATHSASGIQRVIRGLLAALIRPLSGVHPLPMGWDADATR
jgi:hypothetical protein